MRNRIQAYAIIRVDDFLEPIVECRDRVTVKEVVWEQEFAEAEVARLNALNENKGQVYFWQTTRVAPFSDGVAAPEQSDG